MSPGRGIQISMFLYPRRFYSRASRFLAFPSSSNTTKDDRGDAAFHAVAAIQSLSAGTFAILPLANKILERLTKIIDHELDAVEGQKIILPTLSSSQLWRKSGRWDRYGPVLFRLKDRSGKEFCLGPTHEETITHCMATLGPSIASKLPIRLYQTSWKFRDEDRPKRGLLRAREFLMTDMYSFDSTIEDCTKTYDLVAEAYEKILNRIGLPFLRVLASTGDMGGSHSHEYHYCSPVGEDVIYSCERCAQNFNEETLEGNLKCPVCSSQMEKLQGAEIGHTFLLGDTYSKTFNATVVLEGKTVPLQMGCYGIGVSRIMSMAAQLSSQTGTLNLPASIAPFTVGVIAPKPGSHEYEDGYPQAVEIASQLDKILPSQRVILDDRDLTIGRKLRELKSIGTCHQVVVGKNGLELHSPTADFLRVSGIETVYNFFKELVAGQDLL